jgi:hypothetical protein
MILRSLYAYYSQQQSVTDLIGDRLTPAPLPQNTLRPAADFRVVTGRHDHDLSGLTGPVDCTVTIDCYGDSPEQADEVAEAMMYGGIVGYRGLLGGTFLNSVQLIAGPSQSDEGVDPGTDERIYVTSFTLAITYSRNCR